MPNGRQPAEGLELRACASCGKEFQPYRSYQIACSRSCRERTKDQSPRRRLYDLTCKGCGEQFAAIWTGMGRQPTCGPCTAETHRTKKDRHNAARRVDGLRGEYWKEYSRKYRIRRYGITETEFEQLLVTQNGVCAVCGSPPVPGTGPATKRLHVDHNHQTGKIRGLLCNSCNRGIGYFKDDSALLRAAADYIDRYRTMA